MKPIMAALPLAFLVAALFMAHPAQVEARLVDNTNFALGPGNSTYINVMVPADWGEVLKKTTFEVSTDCRQCDIQGETRIMTDMANQVVLPILVPAAAKIGNSYSFKVVLSSGGARKEFHYGVCTSDHEDVDVGEGSPCEVLSRNQNVFAISFDTAEEHVRPGETANFTLYLESEADVTLELSTNTGAGTRDVTLSSGSPQIIAMDMTAPSTTGVYDLKVTAHVKGCSLPSCTAEAVAKLYVELEPGTLRRDFEVSLFPSNYNIEGPGTVSYILNVENYGEPREFTVNVFAPEGTSSTFTTVKKTISGKESMRFTLNAPAGGINFYTIKAIAETSVTSREVEATLSVNEMSSDLDGLQNIVNLSRDSDADVNRWKIDHLDRGTNGNLNSFNSLMGTVTNGTGPDPPPVVDCELYPDSPFCPEPEPDYSGIIYVIVPIAIGCLLVFYWLFAKKKAVAEAGSGQEEFGFNARGD